MEQQTYEITAPNGKVLSITGDHVPTETELHEIFAKAGVETGAKPAVGSHPEARISAAQRGIAWAGDPDDVHVTYDDLVMHPKEAMRQIGTLLKRDATDPKTWLTLALSYFGPKVFNYAAPAIARAAATAGRVSIDPAVAMEEFSLAKPQKVLKAISLKEQPVADRVPGFDRYLPNTSTAVTPTSLPPESVSDGTPPPAGPPAAVAPAESPVVPPAAARPATPPPTSRPAAAAAPPVEPPPAPAAASPGAARPSPHVDTVGLATAQRTKGQMSTAWIQSDLGMAARRQGVTLSDAEFQVAEAAVRDHGVSPAQAVQTVGKLQTQAPPPASKLKFSADESKQFDLLRTSGKSGAEAEAAILQMRKLAKKLKTPTGKQVTDAVEHRNTTGRWDAE